VGIGVNNRFERFAGSVFGAVKRTATTAGFGSMRKVIASLNLEEHTCRGLLPIRYYWHSKRLSNF
jgi:hypothetical protein